MKSLRSDNQGFGVVELVIILVVIGAVGGGGYYVYSKNNAKKPAAPKASTTQSSTTAPITAKKVEPADAVVNFGLAFKAKDQAKFNSLMSDEFKNKSRAQSGSDDFYAMFSSDPVFSSVFTTIDFSKEKATVSDYTSAANVKGKTVTYTITTTIEGARSTNVYTFSLIPKGDNWLLDDISVDSNASANVNTN